MGEIGRSTKRDGIVVGRRTFLAAAVAAASGMAMGQAKAQTRRPNLLFIYTDDQGPWALGAAGNPQAHTPNLDRLFGEGVTLTNSFVTTPVCSPSRTGLLVSRYGSEVGITDWLSPTGRGPRVNESDLGLDPDLPSWVDALQASGYRTGLVGKWHLGFKDRFRPAEFGYKHFAGFRAGGAPVENPELEVNGDVRTREGLTTDLLTDFALDFLMESTAEEPFALSVHYRAPHAPWTPVRDEDRAPYEDKQMTLPDVDVPNLDRERGQRAMAEYLASVTSVDRNVGRILGFLDKSGMAENTIVVFTSDHGYNIGHHGLLHKGNGGWLTTDMRGKPHEEKVRPNMFDTSLRVPTAVRWPDVIEAGSTMDRTFSNLDWYPTLLAMMGVEIPANATVRGKNAWPLLQGKDTEWNDDLYGEYSIHHYAKADLRMYRTPEWKLVRDFRNEGRDELYHLAEDPDETQNLIDEPSAMSVKDRLDAKMRAKMEALGDPVLAGLKDTDESKGGREAR